MWRGRRQKTLIVLIGPKGRIPGICILMFCVHVIIFCNVCKLTTQVFLLCMLTNKLEDLVLDRINENRLFRKDALIVFYL